MSVSAAVLGSRGYGHTPTRHLIALSSVAADDDNGPPGGRAGSGFAGPVRECGGSRALIIRGRCVMLAKAHKEEIQ
jgi:hypothetical protein